MTTRSDLIASIHTALHSYTGTQEQVTWISFAIDAAAANIEVQNTEQAIRGIAEIDEELIYIHSVNGAELYLGPSGYGRGYRGSTAATHAQYAQVVFDPPFPKVEIGRALDQTISALYPALFQVKLTTLDSDPVDISYALPADCTGVLNVEVQRSGDPQDYWQPVGRWEYDNTASAQVVNLPGVLPGCSVRVHYRAPFDTLSTTLTAAGIPESCADLLLYGVASRLIRFATPQRLQLTTAENVSRAQVVTADDAGRLANQLFAVYQNRVAEERRRLLEAHPARPNFSAR